MGVVRQDTEEGDSRGLIHLTTTTRTTEDDGVAKPPYSRANSDWSTLPIAYHTTKHMLTGRSKERLMTATKHQHHHGTLMPVMAEARPSRDMATPFSLVAEHSDLESRPPAADA